VCSSDLTFVLFFLLLLWVNGISLSSPLPQVITTPFYQRSYTQGFSNPITSPGSALTIDAKQAVIQQIKALGLSPMWYSAQYEALKKGTSVFADVSTGSIEQTETSDKPLEFILNKDLVFSPNYRGRVGKPESGWFHFQSKVRIKKASQQSTLTPQLPMGSEAPVFVAAGAVIVQESPETPRYHEYNVHVFNGPSGELRWYEVDSLSISSTTGITDTDLVPTQWHFQTLAVPGGFQLTTRPTNLHSAHARRFAYHIHGLDRRPDAITANGKNIVYIYLPETQSVIFKVSAGEHLLMVRYP